MKNIELPFNGIFSPDEYPELTFFIKRILERAETNDEFTDLSVAFNIGEFLITCNDYAKKQNILPEEEMLERAVKGMLPHTKLGRQMIKKLRVYAGSEHENAAQKPEVWEVK